MGLFVGDTCIEINGSRYPVRSHNCSEQPSAREKTLTDGESVGDTVGLRDGASVGLTLGSGGRIMPGNSSSDL